MNLFTRTVTPFALVAATATFAMQSTVADRNVSSQVQPANSAGGGNAHKSGVTAPADPTYVIGPLDVLTVRVWHEPDLSAQSLPVRPDGKISLSLLNEVQAAGLTPMQLTNEITSGLKKFVSDPQVTVVVDAINSKRIYVLGAVARPGAYPLLPDMSVLQALSGAGGLQQTAHTKNLYVLRANQKIPFNYKKALKGEASANAFALQPGDTVVIP